MKALDVILDPKKGRRNKGEIKEVVVDPPQQKQRISGREERETMIARTRKSATRPIPRFVKKEKSRHRQGEREEKRLARR